MLENQLSAFQPDTIFITFGGSYDGLLEHYLLSWLEKHPIKYIISCSLSPEPEVFKGRETERFKRFMRNADSVLFLSQENQAIVEAQMEIKLPNARIIQNPLWFHLDEPLAPTCIPPIPRLDYIGRISVYHKGLDFLLNAAGSIIDRTPFTIHLTGKVETAEELDALIQSNGLEDHVHIHDPLPPDQVQEAYAKAEIILLTSRTEGCASTMLEAMMCGRTILATPVGGAPDWLTDEENAFLCQSADTASVTSTLIKALDQRSKWPEMGRQARIAFDQKRDPDPADTLLKILKNETSGYNLP
ncbi:MAG: glycosyltransferase family 4 protein [Verrucomicrobiota bacterium]